MAGALLFVEKIRQRATLFWFGLRDGGTLQIFVIQRTIVDFRHCWSTVRRKRSRFVPIQTVIRTSKRLDSVCLKRLRTLKSFQKLKTKIKKSKTYVDDIFKAYPMILLSGRTVPLKPTFNYLPDCQ